MLIRISLILAILAALGAGGLGYYEVSTQIPALTQQRNDEQSAKVVALGQLRDTNRVLVAVRGELSQTRQELADTKSQRDKALAAADAATKKADDLAVNLTKVTQERDDAQNELGAYKATLLSPEQITKLNRNLKDALGQIDVMKDENTVLLREKNRLQVSLLKYEGTNYFVTLPADLHGKILEVDPKWDFVVLNIGENQNVVQDAELLVSREGKLVAKVIVRTVEKERCIANLVPGWKLGEMFEGDVVTPAHPAT